MLTFNKDNFYILSLFIINSLVVVFNFNIILVNVVIVFLIFGHFRKINKNYAIIIFLFLIFKTIQFIILGSNEDYLDVARFSLLIFLINFLEKNSNILSKKYVKYLNFLNINLVLIFSIIFFYNFFPNFNESTIDVTLQIIGLNSLNQTSFVFYLIFCGFIAHNLNGFKGFNKIYIPLLFLLILISFKIIYIISLFTALFIINFFKRKMIVKIVFLYVFLFFLFFFLYGEIFSQEVFDILTNFRGRIWFSLYDDFINSNLQTKLFGFGYEYKPLSEIPFSVGPQYHYTSIHSGYLRFLMLNGFIGLIFLFTYLILLSNIILKKSKSHIFFFLFIIISLASDGSILYKLNDIAIISLLILIPNNFYNTIFEKNEKES